MEKKIQKGSGNGGTNKNMKHTQFVEVFRGCIEMF